MVYEPVSALRVGKSIRDLRIKKGETMDDLARAVLTSQSAIAMYECGKRIPRDEIKIRIAEHYGVPVESIFFPNKQHEKCENEEE